MTIIMTLLVRDEEDIIRENIEYHLSQGVDFIIATDNLSTDSTADILKEYQKKGKLHYIYEASDNYNQTEWVTRMARMAHHDFSADWVINNDADEFWWPRKDNLRQAFANISSEYNVVIANRQDFVAVKGAGKPFYRHMIYREKQSFNSRGLPLPPKIAHRACKDIIVHQGNHDVQGCGEKNATNNIVDIFHFPIRSREQLLNKIISGGAAYERNKQLPQKMGRTWKELYAQYIKHGNLDFYLDKKIYSNARIYTNIFTGQLTRDVRLKRYLDKIFKQGA